MVVITRNRRAELLRTLRSIVALPERPRVVVVANGCDDGTEAAVRASHPEVTVVPLPGNLGAAGRNLGMRVAATRYVAFCDDDTWWEPGAISLACDALDACPSLAVVTAHIVVEPDGTDDPICAELRVSPLPAPLEGAHGLVSFLAGASVVRSRAFFGAGGFEPHLVLGGEEELLGFDLVERGWDLVHLPGARIHHCASARRDPHRRRADGIRNTLLFTWLRRPVPAAGRRTAALVRRLPADRVSAAGLGRALAGAPWVMAARGPVATRAEGYLRLVEAQQLSSGARRYVS